MIQLKDHSELPSTVCESGQLYIIKGAAGAEIFCPTG